MMKSHAVNHGKGTNAVEPALAEIRELMFLGKLISRHAIENCSKRCATIIAMRTSRSSSSATI